MTRKHFEAIARTLRETNAPRLTIIAMASELAKFNPNFNGPRFLKACGL